MIGALIVTGQVVLGICAVVGGVVILIGAAAILAGR